MQLLLIAHILLASILAVLISFYPQGVKQANEKSNKNKLFQLFAITVT